MIRLRVVLMTALLGMVGLGACDVIDGPKRVSSGAVEGCVLGCDSVAVFTEADEVQRVLLEDYTGFQCGNCPLAGLRLVQIRDNYGDRIVPLKAHVGPLARPSSAYPADYRSAVGDQLDEAYGLSSSGVPRGMINRRQFDGLYGQLQQNWTSAVQAVIDETPRIAVQLRTAYNAPNRELSLCMSFKALETLTGQDLNYAVYLTESHIIGYQKWYNNTPEDIYDFEHNYMLREAYGGAFGFQLHDAPLVAGATLTHTTCIAVDNEWVAENMHAILIVTDNQTNEVLNAYRAPVVAN